MRDTQEEQKDLENGCDGRDLNYRWFDSIPYQDEIIAGLVVAFSIVAIVANLSAFLLLCVWIRRADLQ
jgi:hypothetical protein